MKYINIFLILLTITPVMAQTYIPSCYLHKINDTSETGYFAQAMKYLHDEGYETITMKDYDKIRNGQMTSPEKPIMITFDDGRDIALTKAYPIMSKYGYVGIIAYPTGNTPWYNPKLTWDNLTFLQSKGWEIASHTYDDLDMTKVNLSKAIDQMKKSKEKIDSMTGIETTYFVFPNNNANPTLEKECSKIYKYCTGNKSLQDWKVITYNQNISLGLGRTFCDEDGTTLSGQLSQFKRRLLSTNTGYNESTTSTKKPECAIPEYKETKMINGTQYEVWYIRK